MTNWLGYESVYSFQGRAHRHWCRLEAMMLATDVMMKQDLGAGEEVVVEARRKATAKRHSRHAVRCLLVAMASGDDRDIVSYGHDDHGLIASVVYYPSSDLKFEPVWVPRACNTLFIELLRLLEKADLPFPTDEEHDAARG